jgi:hypothetical protein
LSSAHTESGKSQISICIVIATLLQVIGSGVRALFSFWGIKISDNREAYVEHIQKVEIDPHWLRAAQIGLILLVIGILMSGIIAYNTAP